MWYAENTKAFLAMKGIIYSGIGHYTQNWKVANSELNDLLDGLREPNLL